MFNIAKPVFEPQDSPLPSKAISLQVSSAGKKINNSMDSSLSPSSGILRPHIFHRKNTSVSSKRMNPSFKPDKLIKAKSYFLLAELFLIL